jgi:hypothetical protein
MDEIDIWRSAKILIEAHGENAELEAAVRVDQAMWDGSSDAMNVWKRIMRAVQDLQRQKPSASEPLN